MSRMISAVLVALLFVGGMCKDWDREEARANCRAVLQYSSGPGSLEDFANRFTSYFAENGGHYEVLGGTVARTRDEYKNELLKVWDGYKTFNHVFYVEEPTLSGKQCVVTFFHAYLAHDGACGPLIRKGRGVMELTEDNQKVAYWKDFGDFDAMKAEADSCAPGAGGEGAEETNP
jgi:hypothetical protein